MFESPYPEAGDCVRVFKTVHIIGYTMWNTGKWWFNSLCDRTGYINLEMSGVRRTLDPVSCLMCIAEER